MSQLPEYVLVRKAVVYKLTRRSRGPYEYTYLRHSIPPDGMSGKASKFKPDYPPHKLPDHEVIDAAEAKRIVDVSAAEFEQRLAGWKTKASV